MTLGFIMVLNSSPLKIEKDGKKHTENLKL